MIDSITSRSRATSWSFSTLPVLRRWQNAIYPVVETNVGVASWGTADVSCQVWFFHMAVPAASTASKSAVALLAAHQERF